MNKWQVERQGSKFKPIWMGPLVVKQNSKSNGNILELEHPVSKSKFTVHTSDCKPYVGSLKDEEIIMLSQADTNQERIECIIKHIYTDPTPTDGVYLASEFDFLVKYEDDEKVYWTPYSELKFTQQLKDYLRNNALKFQNVKF